MSSSNYLKDNFSIAHNLYYKYLITGYTSELYNQFLSSVENNSTIIDVGIGNGDALLTPENINLIFGKRLQIFGYDIDTDYLEICRSKINKNRLNYNVFLFNKDITTDTITFSQRADYIFFSNSYSVIPNGPKLLQNAIKKFNPVNIVISTSLEEMDSFFRRKMKPNLKYFTFGIDFGRMITQEQFEKEMENADLKIINKGITNTPSFCGIQSNIWTYLLNQKHRKIRKF